jgi:hypothetical protein
MPSPIVVDVVKPVVIGVRGHRMPEAMFHGTEGFTAQWRKQLSGSYECDPIELIDAASGDVRAWPKHGIPTKGHATVVFSPDLALSPDVGGVEGYLRVLREPDTDSIHPCHIRVRQLPPGSYEIVYGKDHDTGDVSYPFKSDYDKAIEAAAARLILKARKARKALQNKE